MHWYIMTFKIFFTLSARTNDKANYYWRTKQFYKYSQPQVHRGLVCTTMSRSFVLLHFWITFCSDIARASAMFFIRVSVTTLSDHCVILRLPNVCLKFSLSSWVDIQPSYFQLSLLIKWTCLWLPFQENICSILLWLYRL